jgi:hypothetical protein
VELESVKDPVFLLDRQEPWRPVSAERAQFLAGEWPEAYLNFPADMAPPATPVVGYRRMKIGSPLNHVQYWLFYPYNPKAYPLEKAGWGAHEGDWEVVQVGYGKHDFVFKDPVLVTASQHQTGEGRGAWECEKTGDGRILIYVARGSHANYFNRTRIARDEADGNGVALKDIEWREFGPWASWLGRWGASRGPGMSPQSPARQSTRWNAPHQWYAEARK